MPLIKKAGTTKGIGPAAAPYDEGDTNLLGEAPAAPAAPTMQPGVVLQGRYAIEGTLGVGGMSVVYRGRDLRFKDVVRPCAIKEMFQSAPDSNTRLLNLKNFERESGLLATLHHPAIPKVYDFFEEHGRFYLILELIPGQDLETVLDEAGGPLPEERVARWAVQICDVLAYLHNRTPEPVVFRDMKPSNVMVTPEERIVLIDFGIARNLNRADRKGTMIGTEGYSPPEQYRGLAEPRGDLYALGATMHQLLSGSDPRLETPFTFHERPLRQLNPSVSPEIDAVVARALEYDASARWGSAEEMKAALLQLPHLVEQVLKCDKQIEEIASRFHTRTDFLYLGRGINYPIALEGALKLKEISYIHAEGYPAGEMKHGPIALIDEKMPVVTIATDDHVFEKMLGNVQEARTRGGSIVALTTQGDERLLPVLDPERDFNITIPKSHPLTAPVLTVVPLQLLAYHIAVRRGCDVDQPRNLAKSVTVE